MGKGFLAHSGLLGQDLGDLLQEACKKRVSVETNWFLLCLTEISGAGSRITCNCQ